MILSAIFRSVRFFCSNWWDTVTVIVGRQSAIFSGRLCSGLVAPFFSLGNLICSSWGRRILLQSGAIYFLLGETHGEISLGTPCSARASGCAFHLVLLETKLFYPLEPPPPLYLGFCLWGNIYLCPSSLQCIYDIIIFQNCHIRCPAYIFSLSRVSAAAVSDLPYLHLLCLHCPVSTPPLFYSTVSYRFPSMLSPSSCISSAACFIILLRIFCSPHHTIFYHPRALPRTFLLQSFVAAMPMTPLFLSFLYPWHCHPCHPFHLFIYFTHHYASPSAAVPHPIIPCLIFPYLKRHDHHTWQCFSIPSLYSTPLENLWIPFILLCSTSLLPTIYCACSSNFSTLIYDFSDPLCSPCSVLLDPFYFNFSNPLYFAHSNLLLSIRAALLDPLHSKILSLLLSIPFFFIFLHSASIVSDHSPQLCLVRSVLSVSFLLIYDWSTHDTLWLIFYVLISWIISAWLGSVWLNSLSSGLSFDPLDLLIFPKITYH